LQTAYMPTKMVGQVCTHFIPTFGKASTGL
jgi:hypothetical protein